MDGFRAFTDDPNQDLILASPIPTSCLKEPVMLGIDEAGRGPVLGPMVYGIAFFAVSKSDQMKSMEFAGNNNTGKRQANFSFSSLSLHIHDSHFLSFVSLQIDSKVLTETKREKIFESIQSHRDVGWSVKILSPNTISNTSLRRRKYNLNQLSHDTAIELVRQVLDKGVNVTELYVDTVGPKDKYQLKLKKIFPSIPKIKVENKADSLFHVVSAASICAKVVRDQVIKEWKFPEGSHIIPPSIDYGSGYPGGKHLHQNISHVCQSVSVCDICTHGSYKQTHTHLFPFNPILYRLYFPLSRNLSARSCDKSLPEESTRSCFWIPDFCTLLLVHSEYNDRK